MRMAHPLSSVEHRISLSPRALTPQVWLTHVLSPGPESCHKADSDGRGETPCPLLTTPPDPTPTPLMGIFNLETKVQGYLGRRLEVTIKFQK
ncbi:hypothetical protein EGR_01825 [Echinococcus granulosus]|uniref:Uncharacterized protein n=1 Tax=Echinococcus granulosus TaxID=6210 RepID=W6V9L1_ECHGR|nr:hypothetical protein EGR_01825 [Echinococcus granulosus]EUB63334.1 hypothetical protein EGR_01825 [Echinococcus granulosus]